LKGLADLGVADVKYNRVGSARKSVAVMSKVELRSWSRVKARWWVPLSAFLAECAWAEVDKNTMSRSAMEIKKAA
jgi:hypothetical protein